MDIYWILQGYALQDVHFHNLKAVSIVRCEQQMRRANKTKMLAFLLLRPAFGTQYNSCDKSK